MQLNAENGEFDEAFERDLPFVQEVEANIEELNQNILALNNEQMDNEISKAKFDLLQTVQENANLRHKLFNPWYIFVPTSTSAKIKICVYTSLNVCCGVRELKKKRN
ncbi:hypothetical protein ISN44_As12g020360 [Arabidopsis suecica]|uniref:Uncharacterized protein n=1 Tax=Arabidopsis suecica TaxID=45249 RepID=A0A8T1YKG2_ARASU|nr:hypothetical protein ISN44_As12g020360 [Arabidopsis suecica]